VKCKDKLCPVRECGPELNGFCHDGKMIDGFVDYTLRCLDWALDDGPLARLGVVLRTRQIRYTHSSKKQTERNNANVTKTEKSF
jgi:hypothetical protein